MLKYKIKRCQRSFYADFMTPVLLWSFFSKEDSAVFFESVTDGKWSRFSYIALRPLFKYEVFPQKLREVLPDGNINREIESGELKKDLKVIFNSFEDASEKKEEFFSGGLMGYFNYDLAAVIEPSAFGPLNKDNLIGEFMFPSLIICFDNLLHKIHLIECFTGAKEIGLINEVMSLIRNQNDIDFSEIKKSENLLGREIKPTIQTNFSDEDFAKAVSGAKKEIEKGEFIQAVISRKFKVSKNLVRAPIDLYRALRYINPSPYMFHLKFNGFHLIGASPETHLRFSSSEALLRPIAGTRRRGKNPEHDEEMARELSSDEKEIAEHLMLIDLARNDLGRFCKPATINCSDLFRIEKYSHVMHMVSDVTGIPSSESDVFDAIWATFPAGTLSGAPKVRAMRSIHEAEGVSRGPYGGIVGYVDFSGKADFCITIRSIWTKGENELEFQTGAGVVYDSKPELEVKETWNKANSVIKAVSLASSWQDDEVH